MKYTVDEATAEVQIAIKGSTAEDRNIFRNWVIRGFKQLGPDRNDVKVAQITPNSNGLILKPDDFVHGIDMSLWDSAGCEIKYNTNHGGTRIHTDRFAIHDSNNQDAITGRVDVSEDAYYYHLGNNRSVVAYALIRYFSYPVDSDGIPLLMEEDLEAIMDYCHYRWARRERNSQSEIQQSYGIWLASMDRRKGAKKMPSTLDMQGIASRYLSIIPLNPESNY